MTVKGISRKIWSYGGSNETLTNKSYWPTSLSNSDVTDTSPVFYYIVNIVDIWASISGFGQMIE